MSIELRKEERVRQQYILYLNVILVAKRTLNIIGAPLGRLSHNISSRRKERKPNVKRFVLQSKAALGGELLTVIRSLSSSGSDIP